MKRVRDAGIVLGLIGLIMLVISGVGSSLILGDYSEDNPSDDTGPCEGSGQDAEACNSLRLIQSPWIPGWVLLLLGIALAVLGVFLSARVQQIAQQPPQQPPEQPPQYPPPP